jgi:hypothetical protein
MKHFGIVIVALAFAGCGKKEDDKKATTSGGITVTDACKRTPVVQESVVGECKIRLLSPTHCQEVDLTNDKVVEFRWTTDGTECPSDQNGQFAGFNIYVAGNPLTQNYDQSYNNLASAGLPLGGDITRTTGVARIRARDLVDKDGKALTSTDGTYDWVVQSGLNSTPASIVIKIKR